MRTHRWLDAIYLGRAAPKRPDSWETRAAMWWLARSTWPRWSYVEVATCPG